MYPIVWLNTGRDFREVAMKTLMKKLSNIDLGLLILRLAVGGLMIPHGISKLFKGTEGIAEMLAARGFPEIIAHGAIVGELIAPLLIVIGLFTRPASAVLAFNMIMSIYLAFGWAGFQLNQHGGITVELNLLYLFGALALMFTGAGRYAVSKNVWS
jgi:putative oxidoreductase